MDPKTAFSGSDILHSFFPLIEDGLVKVISQLDSPRYTEANQTNSAYVDPFPRCIVGYPETVDLYVSYGKKSSEISVRFLTSILPTNFSSATGFSSDLYTKLMDHIRMSNANQNCSQNLINLFLILFFADCSSQILSCFPNSTICTKIIQIGNLVLDFKTENEIEASLKRMIIRQFSVIFSFLSINNLSDLITNFNTLASGSSYRSVDVLILHRFIRLNATESNNEDTIIEFLNSLRKYSMNDEWAEAMIPLIMQVSSDTINKLEPFFEGLAQDLKPIVYSNSGGSSSSNNKNKKSNNQTEANPPSTTGHNLMKLYAISILRDKKLCEANYQNFLDTIIVGKCSNPSYTLGCLEAFLAYLRGKFVSKANLFWEWGKYNAMSHPGIEATHISLPEMEEHKPGWFGEIFIEKIIKSSPSNVVKYPEILSEILLNFAARDFHHFIQLILPSFIQKLDKQAYFPAVNLCLNKIVDTRLRFAEWAQENPRNQDTISKQRISETIPLLFLQLKPTLFMLAKNFDIKKLSEDGFSFHLVDNIDFPVLSLPISQEKITPELKERIRNQYSHQMYIRHLVLEADEVNTSFYNIDTQPKPIAAIENSESDDEENQAPNLSSQPSSPIKSVPSSKTGTKDAASGSTPEPAQTPNPAPAPKNNLEGDLNEKLYDIPIHPRSSFQLTSAEEAYIQVLAFFPRIMNKSDFLSEIGEQLFNSMVSACPAVSLYSIMVVNQLFNAKPEDRIHIFNALIEKILRTKIRGHLFVFMLFFIKLLDLSFKPKCNDQSEIFNFIQRTEALCVYLMTLKSNMITTLCEALSERIHKFATGMRMPAWLYKLRVNYQDEINRAVSEKLKNRLLSFNTKTSRGIKKRQYRLSSNVLFASNLIEVMNLMNLKAPVEFFQSLSEIIFSQMKKTQVPIQGPKTTILIPYLVRYLDEDQINNIKNFLKSNKIINMNAHKFKNHEENDNKDKNMEEEDKNDEEKEERIASYSEFYPISIFDVDCSDAKSKELQSSSREYLISNAKELKLLHWTAVILILTDLNDQLESLNEETLTNQEMDEYVSIFSIAMKSTDVRFAIFADEKVQKSVLNLIQIYINHYSIKMENIDEKDIIQKLKITSSSPLVSSFPNFCYIVSRFFNSFIIDNNACLEGPFRRPNHCSIIQNEAIFGKTINDLFDYLIYFTNTGLYKYTRHAIASILCVFPILDHNEEYMKGKIIRIQINYPIEDENKIRKRIKQDLLSILLQSGNERFILNKINRKRMNIPLYSAICANDESLLPLYIEDVFRCPLLFESLYKYFVGSDDNTRDIGNSDCQFNEKIIKKYAGRLLFMCLFFMMSKKCQIRIKAYNLLKRFAPLFSCVLYTDDKKNGKMMSRLQRLEPSFMSFSSDSELPTIQLLLKFSQIIASSFMNLIDDIVDSLVDCLCTVGINNTIDDANSLYNYCNYYNFHYYSNNDDFLLNKSEIQSNVLQILGMFLRAYNLDEGNGRFTPYSLIRKLLPIYGHLESNAVSNYYALFDQLCEDSQEKVELVINVALHSPSLENDSNQEFDFCPLSSYAIIVHFSTNYCKMIVETLARHLTFSYWYVAVVQKNLEEDKYTQNIQKFYAYYYTVTQALHVILRNSSFVSSSSSNENNSPFEFLKPFFESTINFCLIFFNKTTESLLYDVLTYMNCSEAILSILRNKGENNINLTKNNQFEFQSDSESDSESETEFGKEFEIDENDEEPDLVGFSKLQSKPFTSSSTLFTDLPKEFITNLCDYLREARDYGRAFLNNMGNECLRWCCGCGDLTIAGRSCIVFSEILRPFDSNVIGQIIQSMSFALRASCYNMNRPNSLQDYLTGIFSIFNASIEKYKDKPSFSETFQMIFAICSTILRIPYFKLDINMKSKLLNNNNKNINNIDNSDIRKKIEDECFVSLDSINTSIDLCKAANSVISKFFYYNVVDLKSSNEQLIQILPSIACQCATLRPRETLDAIFLAVFNTGRTHSDDDQKKKEDDEKDLKEKSSLLSTISFILFLPWLHSAFAAYHNVEPYSSLFSDSDIPLVLQIGYLMGNNDQLPDELCTYLVKAMKEPSNASVEDFVLQAGICIARDKPKAFIAAAPLLIEMAKMVSARIIKLNKGKMKGTSSYPTDEEPDFVVTSFYGGVTDGRFKILLNENNNIAFLLAIVVVARSFLEYSKLSKGILAISPLISIVSAALDCYSSDSLSIGLINVNSVAQNIAIDQLKKELAKLVAAFLSFANDPKNNDLEDAESPFRFEVGLCEYSSWENVSEEILKIMRENSIDSIDISPEFHDVASSKGVHTDLSSPILAIPIDPYAWSTKLVKDLRDKMKNVRVKGYTSKQAAVDRAAALEPQIKGESNITVSVPSKYQQYMQYKTKIIT